jgi:hypothetical protein
MGKFFFLFSLREKERERWFADMLGWLDDQEPAEGRRESAGER